MVDTSTWIEYFREGKGTTCDMLDSLLEEDRAVLCGMVELELLRGVRTRERPRLKGLLDALRFVETTREDFIAAGERLCELRERGLTISASDALIAMVSKRNDLSLLTLDSHFKLFSDVKLLGP